MHAPFSFSDIDAVMRAWVAYSGGKAVSYARFRASHSPLISALEATAGRRVDHALLEERFIGIVGEFDNEKRRGPNGTGGMQIMGKDPFGLGPVRPRAAATPEESRARPFRVGTPDAPLLMTGPENGEDSVSWNPPSSRRARATTPNRKRA